MDYITEIILTINQVHQCAAVHRATMPAAKFFDGYPVWDGNVEVFALVNHPKAKKVYAWGSPVEESDEPREITTLVGIPPSAKKSAGRDST